MFYFILLIAVIIGLYFYIKHKSSHSTENESSKEINSPSNILLKYKVLIEYIKTGYPNADMRILSNNSAILKFSNNIGRTSYSFTEKFNRIYIDWEFNSKNHGTEIFTFDYLSTYDQNKMIENLLDILCRIQKRAFNINFEDSDDNGKETQKLSAHFQIVKTYLSLNPDLKIEIDNALKKQPKVEDYVKPANDRLSNKFKNMATYFNSRKDDLKMELFQDNEKDIIFRFPILTFGKIMGYNYFALGGGFGTYNIVMYTMSNKGHSIFGPIEPIKEDLSNNDCETKFNEMCLALLTNPEYTLIAIGDIK